MVESYIKVDPLAPLRQAAQTELLLAKRDGRGVLHVIHDHGGGTEAHVRALIDASRDRWRHYLAIAVGDAWQIEEHYADGSIVTFNVVRLQDESWREFIGAICATFSVAVMHLHNISGCREGLLTALDDLGVPYGYTVHDLNFACPTITFLGTDQMFCGAVTDMAVCNRCLAGQPAYANIEIGRWRDRHRALLEGAAFVIAPSRWASNMLTGYFPGCNVHLIVHGTPDADSPVRSALPTASLALPDDDVPTIALLGAIGPDKGARRIERLVELARRRNVAVRFVLIGYLDVQHSPWQSDDARFSVHGRYERDQLPTLLAHYRVKLVLYPSAGPETFSYTLSEAWAASVPVLVPPIGALAERVAESGAGWVMTQAQWRDENLMLDRVAHLVSEANRHELDAARMCAHAMPHATFAEMTDATFAVYDAALARSHPHLALKPLSRVRIREALGYRPWTPPTTAVPFAPPASAPAMRLPDVATRVAHAALAIRHTVLGRTLYRVTPRPVRDALKARLKA